MDNKRFDHTEHHMRTAADGWEPPFDEKAWEQMEQMLERENDRKRPVAWWMWLLPLLLITGAASYFILRNDNAGKQYSIPAAQNIISNNSGNKIGKENNIASPKDNINGMEENGEAVNPDTAVPQPKNKAGKPDLRNTSSKAPLYPNVDNAGKANKSSYQENGKIKMSVSGGIVSEEMDDMKQPDNKINESEKQLSAGGMPAINKETAVLNTLNTAKNQENEKPAKEINSKEKKINSKEKQPSKFYFSLAAGMEGNGVNFPGINKISARGGFTVGYQLNKNLSVQTGFFAGSKKYVAGKDDYKAKAGSYWSTVDITRVEADCRVFEIPLALRYDFAPSNKWNAFMSTGLSSYIMDKEDYVYDYIRYNNPYQATASYKGNQHFLSVLRVSGGVERKLSKGLSISVIPGIAVPLAGVGDGKIKLFSSELLIGLKYRPFKKSK